MLKQTSYLLFTFKLMMISVLKQPWMFCLQVLHHWICSSFMLKTWRLDSMMRKRL